MVKDGLLTFGDWAVCIPVSLENGAGVYRKLLSLLGNYMLGWWKLCV